MCQFVQQQCVTSCWRQATGKLRRKNKANRWPRSPEHWRDGVLNHDCLRRMLQSDLPGKLLHALRQRTLSTCRSLDKTVKLPGAAEQQQQAETSSEKPTDR